MNQSTRRGRPRDAGVDDAVIEAALDLVAEVGPAAVTIDAIAARAGVSKAAIYRRWDGKESLIVAGVTKRIGGLQLPDDGPIRDVLISTLERLSEFFSVSKAGTVFPWLFGEVANRTEIGKSYITHVIQPRRSRLVGLIQGAIDDGELRSGLDAELCADMVLGPIIVGKLLRTPGPRDPRAARQLVDTLLNGWLAD
jgi:AcrR family transcriptional regulator